MTHLILLVDFQQFQVLQKLVSNILRDSQNQQHTFLDQTINIFKKYNPDMAIIANLILILLTNMVFGKEETCAYEQFGSDHTMCKYDAKACPAGLLKSDVTPDDIKAVLDTHNTLRNKVASGNEPGQPKASNMQEMKWDSELATVAQRWADQCNFGHDTNRRTSTYKSVGQNVAMTGSTKLDTTADFAKPVNMWYNEVVNPGFNSDHIDPFQYESGAGHYTQLAWAESNRIGCGFTAYQSNGFYRKLYVCNYGPAGNVVGGGTSMYKLGAPASACNTVKSAYYSGLCSS